MNRTTFPAAPVLALPAPAPAGAATDRVRIGYGGLVRGVERGPVIAIGG